MKRRIFSILFLLLLFLCACGKEPTETKPSHETKEEPAQTLAQTKTQEQTQTEEESKTEEQIPEQIPATSTVPPATTIVSSTSHSHTWNVGSTTAASCASNGLRVYTCSCGAKKEEVLLSLPHDFASQGCGKRFRCKACGEEGELARHRFDKNTCTICSLTVTSPVFVLNTQLDYDEKMDAIISKLGNPTEILSEGELKSLVYASDLSTLTVVQTDGAGLWGVFTLDPNAFFYISGQVIKADGFSGKPDTQSDTSYRELGDCRIYGFRDKLGSGKYYGMWMRYTECDYHYLTDPRIVQNYETQEKLSFYYVNGLRAVNGLSPLSWSSKAAQVSRDYAKKMADENFFDHDGLYGNRLTAAGVVWRSCGENVSQGYTSAYFVCDAYYNCAPHRNNILNSSFTHVGMGYAMQTDGTYPVSV